MHACACALLFLFRAKRFDHSQWRSAIDPLASRHQCSLIFALTRVLEMRPLPAAPLLSAVLGTLDRCVPRCVCLCFRVLACMSVKEVGVALRLPWVFASAAWRHWRVTSVQSLPCGPTHFQGHWRLACVCVLPAQLLWRRAAWTHGRCARRLSGACVCVCVCV
jgi:hypothetical protein